MRSLWPRGGLWRHGDFLKLWSAETISQFGSQVDDLAIGFVAIVVLDASAFEVSVVDALTLWHLYAVVFLVGICTVFFDVAYQSYLPALVARDQIIDGNSKLEISRSAAQVSGPGLGGVLVEIFTAPYAVLVDAVSFLGSGLFVLGIRKHEDRPARETVDGRKSTLWTELREGFRFVLGNPNLRAQAACTGTSNFFSNVAFAIILVYLVRELGLSAAVIGIAFSIGSAGSLLAAFTATRLSRRYGIGPTTIAVGLLWGPSTLLIALAPEGDAAIAFLVAAVVVGGFSIVTYNIIQVSYRQAICPTRLQGRMNSVMRFIVWGTIPIGALVGGALGSWLGLRETIVVGGIRGSLSILWIVFSPQRHLRDMPEPVDDQPPQTDAAVPGVVDPWAPVDDTTP